MSGADNHGRVRRKGSALVLSLILVMMLSALSMAMLTQSGVNVQVAVNQQQASRALTSAQSGLDIAGYYLRSANISASIAPADRLETLAAHLQGAFDGAAITNISASYDAGTKTLTISDVTLNGQTNQSFAATVTYGGDYDTLNLVVTGRSRHFDKKVGVSYQFTTIGNPIFDFGIATKGPLHMQGKVDVDGHNEDIEGNVYIESFKSNLALDMKGTSAIAGDVTIANGAATVAIANGSSVCGASGSAAMAYITIGETPCDFPIPNPSEFEGYIQHTFDPAVDGTTNVTLTNVEIPANTNPSFAGHAVINGVMFIRSPNIVSFAGNAEVHGLIVAEGEMDLPSENNLLDFGGTVEGYDVTTADMSAGQLGDLADHKGTFLLAPGFSANFRGDFAAINGVIAASGIEFNGNAGGTINGSVINYSDDTMSLTGNTGLTFNRSGVQKNPAGFIPTITLEFVANSYFEPMS